MGYSMGLLKKWYLLWFTMVYYGSIQFNPRIAKIGIELMGITGLNWIELDWIGIELDWILWDWIHGIELDWTDLTHGYYGIEWDYCILLLGNSCFFDPLIIPNNNPMDKSYAVRIPWTSLTYIKKYAHLSILLGQESIGLIGKWSELRHTHTHTYFSRKNNDSMQLNGM